MSVLIPRSVRHPGSQGKSLQPTLAVGTLVLANGVPMEIGAVRAKKKYARRYAVGDAFIGYVWMRRDQFTLVR